MKSKKFSYNKIFVLFSIVVVLVLMTGCNFVDTYGSINVNSTPPGAKVYLDGVDTGQATPIILTNVAAGDHTVKLSKYHYKDWEDVVTVIAGQTTYLNPLLIWAPEETITIQPGSIDGKDACVYNNTPTYNGGNVPILCIGTITGPITGPNIYRGYFQFDLSSIPQNAVILDAALGLNHDFTSSPFISFSLGLYEVTESWEEETINWNNLPAGSNEAEDIQNIPASPTYDFVYWHIDNLVRGWHDGSIANYGMRLRDIDETSAESLGCFPSSDHSEESKHPKLILIFYMR